MPEFGPNVTPLLVVRGDGTGQWTVGGVQLDSKGVAASQPGDHSKEGM